MRIILNNAVPLPLKWYLGRPPSKPHLRVQKGRSDQSLPATNRKSLSRMQVSLALYISNADSGTLVSLKRRAGILSNTPTESSNPCRTVVGYPEPVNASSVPFMESLEWQYCLSHNIDILVFVCILLSHIVLLLHLWHHYAAKSMSTILSIMATQMDVSDLWQSRSLKAI